MKLTRQTLKSIIDALPIGTLLANQDNEIIYLNHKAEDLFGFNEDELVGSTIDKLIPERYRLAHKKLAGDYTKAPSHRAMNQGRILSGLKKNGEEIQVQIGLSPLLLDNNSFVLVSVLEVSNRVLKIAALNDPLTDLPGRALFLAMSENLRNLAIRNEVTLSLMFIDLDRFKIVNDRYGHETGDQVLQQVAKTLQGNIRKNDIAGRFGGDEFIICLYGIKKSDDLKRMGNNLLREIASIRNVNGEKIDIGASIGALSITRPDNITLGEMIKIADQLMYKAKKRKKVKVVLKKI